MQTLLGVVTGTKPDKHGAPVAWVKPLVEVDSWRAIDPEEFPSRGYLFWPRANEAIQNALVFVHPKETTVRSPGNKDDFMVVDPHMALEVLDLRRLGDQEHIRTNLANGIPLPSVPPGRTLLWCEDDFVVGPVTLIGGRTGVTLDKNNRSRIPCFHLRKGEIRSVVFDGITRQVFVWPSLGPPTRFVDWDEDRQVVRRAVELAVELARSSGNTIDHAKQFIEEATESLTQTGSSAEQLLSLNRLQRTQALVDTMLQSESIAREIALALRKHPAILKELEELRTAERKTARAEVESEIKKEREELIRLHAERASVESGLAAARRAIQEAQVENTRKAEEIDRQIQTRIAAAVNSAPALLAEVSILKPFIRGVASSFSSAPSRDSAYVHPRWKLGSNLLSTVKELRSQILPMLKAIGVAAPFYQRLHAAFAAKLMPVITGPRAIDALYAYANVASGGRIAVLQVTSSLTEAGDIFGRIDPTSGRFVPHAGGLIDVVQAAKESEGLLIVVLEGANRGATESYLLPLIHCAYRKNSPVTVFHPSAVDPTSPYKDAARIDWPSNLLLAATLIEGPTTLPVAPDVWTDSVLITTDDECLCTGTTPSQTPTAVFEIDPKSRLLTPAQAGETVETGGDPLDGVVTSSSIRDVGSRFEQGLRIFPADVTSLQIEIARAVLVPVLASIEDDDERASSISEIGKNLGPKGSFKLSEAVEVAHRRIG